MDVFAEVTRIEKEAEGILAQARSDRDALVKKAEADAAACREESQKRLARDSRALREEHQRRLAAEKTTLEEDFKVRKARLEAIALDRTAGLAEWVVSRFLQLVRRSLGEGGRENR